MRLRKPSLGSIGLIVFVAVAVVFLGRGFLHRSQYAAEPGAQQDPASAFTNNEPNLVAAMFYSAWCSSCAVLDPKLREIAPEFDGRAVRFIKFDFSMGPNEGHAERAAELGIADVYEANKGATGFMALVDSRTEDVLSTIYMSDSEQDIRDKLNEAIRAASLPLAADQMSELEIVR